jgi:hypothetical protein
MAMTAQTLEDVGELAQQLRKRSSTPRPQPTGGSSSPRTTTPRAASAARCSKRSATRATRPGSPTRAVRGLPGSGTPAELMEAAGISVGHIVQADRDLLGA